MKTDWVAEYFCAMRDCGEDISIVFGQKKASVHGEPQWFELPHNQFDGISGLANLLRRQGFRMDKLPVFAGNKLTVGRGLRGVCTVLPTVKSRRQEWRHFDRTRPVRFLSVEQRVAWQLFSEEQTRRIASAAKGAGVTVNTYLLFYLDAVVSTLLMPPSSNRRWMIPVNLRGAVSRPAESPPHMSFLGVDLERELSVEQLQALINGLKERDYHWGTWLMLQFGRVVGADGIRRDMRKRERQDHGLTGIFSNLGVWDVPGSGNWIFCPAVSRVYPVGAGCITMNGRLGLAMQLHDAFDSDLKTSYSLLNAWKQACLQECSVDESEAGELVAQPV